MDPHTQTPQTVEGCGDGSVCGGMVRCLPGQAGQRRLPCRRDKGPKTKRRGERPRPAARWAKAQQEHEGAGPHQNTGGSKGLTGEGSAGQQGAQWLQETQQRTGSFRES